MQTFDLYKDIAERTNGDIYIGVVGPVRTGKSTFIKRFMDLLVIPNIQNVYSKERTKDELPQSAAGKTIMTTEPKFVPSEAIEISLEPNVSFKVRMIDCVGYLVPGAMGYMDGEHPRMISTPWSDQKMPFVQAAEMGTKKVITEHSTIGVVITTDGSITEIPRADYIEAEERVVGELRALNKPFVMVLNTIKPYAPETETLRQEIAERCGVPVMALNCAQLRIEDINGLLEKVLFEFPVQKIHINLPKWVETLSPDHWLKQDLINTVRTMMVSVSKLREVRNNLSVLEENDNVKKAYVDKIALGEGRACVEISIDDGLFYRVLSETTGMEIDGEYKLISTIKVLAQAKHEYDKVKFALEEVKHKGYGIVTPALEEMNLEEPYIVKHGSKYGVRLRASAPSIHAASIKPQFHVHTRKWA